MSDNYLVVPIAEADMNEERALVALSALYQQAKYGNNKTIDKLSLNKADGIYKLEAWLV